TYLSLGFYIFGKLSSFLSFVYFTSNYSLSPVPIREQSTHLAHVIKDYEQLILTLKDILHRLCSLNKRRKKLNTVDLMANCAA
ncbi:MAG: hypothetical protein QM487_16140, partial [Candidatus Marithrix sp.]